MNKSKVLVLAVAATFGLSGCAQFRSWTSGMRDSMSGSSTSARTTGTSASGASMRTAGPSALSSPTNPNGIGDVPEYAGGPMR